MCGAIVVTVEGDLCTSANTAGGAASTSTSSSRRTNPATMTVELAGDTLLSIVTNDEGP